MFLRFLVVLVFKIVKFVEGIDYMNGFYLFFSKCVLNIVEVVYIYYVIESNIFGM